MELGTHAFYGAEQIKRVRLVRRADGYYAQFCIKVEVREELPPSGNTVGLDVGLKEFYTDSNGQCEPNPRFYRNAEKKLKRAHRRVSKKQKGSANRKKAVNRLGRVHLKISRQREEHAKRENLRIKNIVRNHCLAKSIHDAGWYQFRKWLEHFGVKFGKITVAVNPAYTSQKCSSCGTVVKKSLSTRTHVCQCGCELDRDHNAAINILNTALSTVGHTETWVNDPNASGDLTATLAGANLSEQVGSLKEESPRRDSWGVSTPSQKTCALFRDRPDHPGMVCIWENEPERRSRCLESEIGHLLTSPPSRVE